MLAGRNFVMVLFHRDAHLESRRDHFSANVGHGIDRRHREVAALDGRAMAHIAFRIVRATVVGALNAVDLIEAAAHRVLKADIVEHEEFGFRAEIGRITNATGFEIGEGQLGRAARVAGIGFTRSRLENVADKNKLRLCRERVHDRRTKVGHQNHV